MDEGWRGSVQCHGCANAPGSKGMRCGSGWQWSAVAVGGSPSAVAGVGRRTTW
jgi:hypothetical protein